MHSPEEELEQLQEASYVPQELKAKSRQEQINDYLNRNFQYHPVRTDACQQKHDEVNVAAREFARCVLEYGTGLNHSEFLTQIQFTRMMLNQSITQDEILEMEAKAKSVMS